MLNHNRLLFPIIALFIIFTGCPRADNTVTLVIEGNPILTPQIAEYLAPSLLDDSNWSHISWWQTGLGKTKLSLSPIKDPEVLRSRIYFGAVTRIEERTVYVKADPFCGTILVALKRIQKIIDEFIRDNVSLL
jgi:hypothetical protein